MKAKLSKRIPDELRRWLNDCFNAAVKRLGIADYERTVYIKIGYSPIGSAETERGAIAPLAGDDWTWPAPPRSFALMLAPDHPPQMLESMCHELIHLKQWCHGELGIGRDKNGRYEPLYFNQNVERLPYAQRPFEQEAHRDMTKLALEVVKQVGWPDIKQMFRFKQQERKAA